VSGVNGVSGVSGVPVRARWCGVFPIADALRLRRRGFFCLRALVVVFCGGAGEYVVSLSSACSENSAVLAVFEVDMFIFLHGG